MSRFLICSFALVLLYPAGIDMYLVGLPRIAADLNASEAQLHIAFSVYLAGMAAAMLFAGKVADRSGRKPVAIPGAALFIIASVFCSLAETSTLFLAGRLGNHLCPNGNSPDPPSPRMLCVTLLSGRFSPCPAF